MGLPVLKLTPQKLDASERSTMVDIYSRYRAMSNESLRRAILDRNRIDILATEILGYEVQPFHLSLLKYQFQHNDTLQLVFRGAGKSTLCTVAKGIHYLLKNPNIRILLASKTTANAEGFLKEIKGHFESNKRLIEIFGEYYDPRKVPKWDNREIEVLPRTTHVKEASITCVGVESTIVSKHYDVIISDDLVDEENSRTQYMRDRVKTWYYQTLDPCLEPPDKEVEHRGEHHRLGTRYHYGDLYGHLIKNELLEHHQIIRALDENGNSPWPEKYPPEWFIEKRKKSGIIIFNAQYQCDTEAMKGEVFQYDDCQLVTANEVPKALQVYMGSDLAISQKSTSNQFAQVVIGEDMAGNIYVLDIYSGHLRFPQQVLEFEDMYRRHDPIRAAVETNAYQAALYQALKEKDKDYRITPINQDKDKMTRAWKMSSLFEDKRMHFVKGLNDIVDQLTLFPNHPLDDLFDALDLALAARKAKTKKKRRTEEPGVI